MELIVDLHVHSHYSRATSKSCTIEGLYYWGKKKGINIIGTGDFTHPEWFAEFREKLVPTEGGLFALRPDIADEIDKTLPDSVRGNLIRFVPTVEIATIYKKGERVRKLHQLIVIPTFAAVSRLNGALERIGNLKADGRPILGLDSKELLRMSLAADPESLYIPAHIWTPWFGMFGSKSGFDTIQEAYDELAPEIHAIETGLSSDPPMNWQLSQLEGISITSNSDAHSPQKLGREATLMACNPTYADVIGAIKTNDTRLSGTIEFYPEEGKYHYDGHRACNVRFSPDETRAHNGICPVCGKPLIVGVDYRVEQLADRTLGQFNPGKKVEYIVPLIEVIAELNGTKSTTGKAVVEQYDNLIAVLGDEFSILRALPLDAIRAYNPHVALAVERIRTQQVYRDPGYDGVYGTIKVFKDASEKAATLNQLSLL
ncbi:MAG TPA: endonuclease Q family protein [Candidatus Saccharimonadales bacterium]|nr:endonuclease Q family protein [Candidatus Saccharimonadales bacterium]